MFTKTQIVNFPLKRFEHMGGKKKIRRMISIHRKQPATLRIYNSIGRQAETIARVHLESSNKMKECLQNRTTLPIARLYGI